MTVALPLRCVTTALAGLLLGGACGPVAAQTRWQFKVLLGDSEIGEHRFELSPQGEQQRMQIDAAFTVKLLGLTVYRYRHQATEDWAGACLARLESRTDDNGTPLSVSTRSEGGALIAQAPAGVTRLPACTMSFAYWNPAMLQQTALLNAQTGKLETVQIRALGEQPYTLRGQPVTARQYRIDGLERPLWLWYGSDGQWLGLESTVTGGQRLRYVLQ